MEDYEQAKQNLETAKIDQIKIEQLEDLLKNYDRYTSVNKDGGMPLFAIYAENIGVSDYIPMRLLGEDDFLELFYKDMKPKLEVSLARHKADFIAIMKCVSA